MSGIENESNSVQFWLYLISDVLSIICCSVLLYYILSNRTIRTGIHNHIIIILLFMCLIYELIDIPLILYNIYWEMSSFLYKFWSFIDIGLYNTQLILFAQGVIERYIIVFHESWLCTLKRRIYIHYLPTILLIFYCLIWYSTTISHLFDHPFIRYFDFISHQVIPFLIIILFSITLLLNGQSKQRKIIFQIISISILYLIFYIPWIFVWICIQFDSVKHIGILIMPYAYFLSYYFIFLFPFICWISLPEFELINSRD